MNSMTCPFCSGPVHKKNKVKIARLGGQLVQRYYCPPPNCKKYHLRDLESGALIDLPERSAATSPRSALVVNVPVHVDLAKRFGIDFDALEPKAFDKGKPRFNVNGFSAEDLEAMLARSKDDHDAAMLATDLILVGQAVIAAIKAKKGA